MPKKILVVDDAETILMMERMILGTEYDVVVARNGSEAVSTAIVERPDLILLDVVMPVLGGIEACRRLRRTPETKDVPIIMVTTRSEIAHVEASFESGCNDYVTKPINGLELITKVRNFIGE